MNSSASRNTFRFRSLFDKQEGVEFYRTGAKRSTFLLKRYSLVILGLFSLVAGALFGWVVAEIDARAQLHLLANYRPTAPTRLYDRNGKVFAELYRHRQELVTLAEVPPHLIQAFLAVEDDNFFHHIGVDLFGISRAAWKNIRKGRITEGGSTLTQQLAKQIYLNAEGRRERSFYQKIRETILAFQIEEELSKEEILEVFFNVIYLGHGCKGVACAARLYFDKHTSELSLAEGALLARLPRSPSLYSPLKNPHNARKEHKLVLGRMATVGYLAKEEVEPIHTAFWESYWPKIMVRSSTQTTHSVRLDRAPYFTDHVRSLLEKRAEVGPQALYSQGLNIYTTLDLQHQQIAEEEMGKTLQRLRRTSRPHARSGGVSGVNFELFDLTGVLSLLLPIGRPERKELDISDKLRRNTFESLLDGLQLLSYLTSGHNEVGLFEDFRNQTYTHTTNLEVEQAFLAVEPHSGFITAMIGGAEFSPGNQFNRALQALRQPGSAFKIFVYGSALEQRSISSTTAINDAPIATMSSDGSFWSPENYQAGFQGLVSARQALASSLNTCAVQVYFRIGPQPIVDFASRLMKIDEPERFRQEPSLALGSGEISPLELTMAMAIIANQGRNVIPFTVRYVVDQNGKLLLNYEEEIRRKLMAETQKGTIQRIEPGLALILSDMLEHVSNAGTAQYSLRGRGEFSGDIASKTGTTSNFSDAWVTGFNPEYAATVWFGFDKSSITLGPGQSGGGVAAPVLGRFYRRIYGGREGDKKKRQAYPRFPSIGSSGKLPKDIVRSTCGGFGLAPKMIDGELVKIPADGICTNRSMYGYRRWLMNEFQITSEELGEKGAVRFKEEE